MHALTQVDDKADVFSFSVVLAVIHDQTEPNTKDGIPQCHTAPRWFKDLLHSMRLTDEREAIQQLRRGHYGQQRPSALQVRRVLKANLEA